jgi:replication factor A1
MFEWSITLVTRITTTGNSALSITSHTSCVQSNPAPGYGAPLPARYEGKPGATARNAAPSHYTPIKDISPYIARWTLKGRVSSKGELRRYSKGGNDGCVFNFDMTDATGEVRIVAFKEVAEKFYDRLTVGKVYTLSRATARMMDAGKRKWNQTGHDCEIYLENASEVRFVCCGALSASLVCFSVV